MSELFLQLSQDSSTTFFSVILLALACTLTISQLLGNCIAIFYIGEDFSNQKKFWGRAGLFIFGQMIAMSTIVFILWALQLPSKDELPLLPLLTGLAFIFVGLILLVSTHKRVQNFKQQLPAFIRDGYLSSLFIGVLLASSLFANHFTFFVGDLMQQVLGSKVGSTLPSLFAVGLFLPILFVFFLIWVSRLTKWFYQYRLIVLKILFISMIFLGFWMIFC